MGAMTDRRLRRRAGAVLLAAALLTSCGGDGDDDTAGDTAEGELELAPTPTTTPEHTALSEVILADDPPGFAVINDAPLDAEDAAAAFPGDQEAEQTRLEESGFEAGWVRAWTDPEEDYIFVEVHQFADVDGAEADLERLRTFYTDEFDAEPFDVPDLEGAEGHSYEIEDGDTTVTAQVVTFARDERVFITYIQSFEGRATPDDARGLAADQAERAEAD
jgi:hypothetical protein